MSAKKKKPAKKGATKKRAKKPAASPVKARSRVSAATTRAKVAPKKKARQTVSKRPAKVAPKKSARKPVSTRKTPAKPAKKPTYHKLPAKKPAAKKPAKKSAASKLERENARLKRLLAAALSGKATRAEVVAALAPANKPRVEKGFLELQDVPLPGQPPRIFNRRESALPGGKLVRAKRAASPRAELARQFRKLRREARLANKIVPPQSAGTLTKGRPGWGKRWEELGSDNRPRIFRSVRYKKGVRLGLLTPQTYDDIEQVIFDAAQYVWKLAEQRGWSDPDLSCKFRMLSMGTTAGYDAVALLNGKNAPDLFQAWISVPLSKSLPAFADSLRRKLYECASARDAVVHVEEAVVFVTDRKGSP